MKTCVGFITTALLLMTFFTACGGGNKENDTVSISISPQSQSALVGESRIFTISTKNTDFSFTPPTGSGCSRIGGSNSIVCVPTAVGTYNIIVRATADTTKSTQATLKVEPVISISISPQSQSAIIGESKTFIVATQNTDFTLSVTPSGSGCSISGNNVVCTSATANTYNITVRATANTGNSAAATLTVVQPPKVSISISPQSQSAVIGESKTFTVTTQNTEFSFVPPSGSGCSRFGDNIICMPTEAGTYNITVRATADTDKSATATLTVTSPPVVSISVTPPSQNAIVGESRKFTVSTQNTDFSFLVVPSGSGCSRSGNSIVCVPTAAGTYTITVTATADGTKIIIVTLTVTSPPASISISAEPDRIRAGQSVKLTATAQNTGVTWPSAYDVAGSFTASGNEATWTPPATEGTYCFTVKASADASKTATACVEVYIPSEDPINIWYYGINNNDQIAGAGFYSDGTVRAYTKNGDDWDIFDHPDAFDYTYAIGINDYGHILGYYESGYFLKMEDAYEQIEDYPSAYTTDYTGINNSGQLSGYLTYSDGYSQGFIRTGSNFSPYEHPDSSYNACNWFLPCGTWFTGINNNGEVVGVYTDTNGIYRSFLYYGTGAPTPIDHPNSATGTIYTSVNGINDSGQAVGYFWDSTETNTPGHGFVYNGVFEVFDHPGAAITGEGTYILGINNAGQAVGWFDDGEKSQGFQMDY